MIVSEREILRAIAFQLSRIASSLEAIQHVVVPPDLILSAPEPAHGNDPDHPWHWEDLQYIEHEKGRDKQDV